MTRALLIAFTLFVASCGGKEESSGGGGGTTEPDKPKEPDKAGSGSAKEAAGSGSGTAAGSGSGVAAKVETLPTEVDFEDDSMTKITEKTVAADLANLEKEIGDGEPKKDDGKDEPKKDEPKKK